MFKRIRKILPGKIGGKSDPVIPVVRLHGAIGMSAPMKHDLSLSSVANNLEKAFSVKKAPAVALTVNSPGGSPVQSRLIYQRIRALAEEKEKPVMVFVEDVAASGGYMIAIAGDEIFADPSSIIGSIGVVSAGFGFVDAISKLGIERRVYTSGEKKAILDPFKPAVKEEVDHLESLQLEIHEIFIDMVRERRGEVLSKEEELFDGRFWPGGRARNLGLVDEIGDVRGVVKKRFGEDAELRLIGGERSFFPKRSGIGVNLGNVAQEVGGGLISALEERAMWSRYGL